MDKKLTADGSDFIVVVAEITDDNGNVKRLAKDNIEFSIEGEGRIIGDESILANPRVVEWGSAPVLIQATDKPGKITIHARSAFSGVYAPTEASLTIESVPSQFPKCYTDQPSAKVIRQASASAETKQMSEEERQRTLEEVNRQQMDFGIQ